LRREGNKRNQCINTYTQVLYAVHSSLCSDGRRCTRISWSRKCHCRRRTLPLPLHGSLSLSSTTLLHQAGGRYAFPMSTSSTFSWSLVIARAWEPGREEKVGVYLRYHCATAGTSRIRPVLVHRVAGLGIGLQRRDSLAALLTNLLWRQDLGTLIWRERRGSDTGLHHGVSLRSTAHAGLGAGCWVPSTLHCESRSP
jgi:hypothetical protein